MRDLTGTETNSKMTARGKLVNGSNRNGSPRNHQRPDAPLFSNNELPEIQNGDETLELRMLYQRNEMLLHFMENISAAFYCIGPDGVITWANTAALDMMGYRWDEYVGHEIGEFHIDPSLAQDIVKCLQTRNEPIDCETMLICKSGTPKDVTIRFNPYWKNGKFLYSSCCAQDNTQKKNAEIALRLARLELEIEGEEHSDQLKDSNLRLHLLLEVTRSVSAASSFNEALETALSIICRVAQWESGEAWTPDPRNETLILSKIWHKKKEQKIDAFERSRERLRLKKGNGIPGKVFETNQPIWIPELETCDFFSRSSIAKKAGIQSAFAVPVHLNDKLVAILTFFAKSYRDEDGHFIELTNSIASQLGSCFQLHQTNEKLLQREEHLAKAQRIARLGSWMWNPKSDRFTFSQTLFDLLGITAQDFDGTFEAYLKLIHPDDRKKVETAIRNAIENQKHFSHEERIVRPDGSQRVLYAESSITETKAGSIKVVGICRDITERKISELTERHLASLVQASEDAIIGKTLEGTITSWNTGAEAIFGYPAHEVVGQSIYLLSPPDRKEEQDQILKRLKRGLGLKQLETVRLRKDGTPINVQVTVSPIKDGDGKTIGAVNITRDITKLKHLETMVLEISEREQRRIGQDIHDGLSQELSAVSYMSHLLERKLKAKNFPEAADASRITELLADAGSQTRQVARGLLPVNKKEPGGLAAALKRLVSTIEKTYAIESWFEGDPKVRISNEMTSTHLYRIAQEATNNAIRHGRASEIGISLKRLKDRIRMVIEDNGVGFPKRIPKSRTRGMGLESMNFRARAVGATLTVKRKKPQGTRVECYLSVARLKRRN